MCPASNTIRILHVDDEPDFAELTASFLEREGDRFQVETATSGDEGVAVLREAGFDCVVSDYDMPGQNGIEFLGRVRELHGDLPFILFTGKGSEEVASEAISAGVNDYLQKRPGTERFELLANRIENAVHQWYAQRNYRELFEKSAVGVAILDPETGLFTDVNERFGQILERDVSTILGTHPGELSDDASAFSRERAHQLLDRTIDEGEQSFEWRHRTGRGEPVWVEVTLNRTTINGRDRILGIVRDITDRKAHERELERSERRYEAVFHDPNILVGLIDTDGTVLDINETAMEYIGAELDEIVGVPFPETPWFDHSERLRAEVRGWIDRAADGEYVEFEAELRRPDGEPYAIEGVFRPVTDDDGEVVSLLISDRDVSEQQRRERELERTNVLLSTLFEALPVGVLAEDASRNVLAVNDQLVEPFDLPGDSETAVGADCAELAETVSPVFTDPEGFVERIEEIVASEKPTDHETLALEDGRTFSRSYRPIELREGRGHLWVYWGPSDRNG